MDFSLLPSLAFAILTYHSAISAYHARDEPSRIAFVASSYVLLMLLFWTVRVLERTPMHHVEKRGQLTLIIWAVSVMLNFNFAYRVAEMLPLDMARLVWCAAGGVAAFGLWLCSG